MKKITQTKRKKEPIYRLTRSDDSQGRQGMSSSYEIAICDSAENDGEGLEDCLSLKRVKIFIKYDNKVKQLVVRFDNDKKYD